ncbi:FCS-Like Zinc finger 17-like [Rutidosis leptorrhynchoides]|uniref:FCS-Like Zinc finger 17-like n=1 Tax=Rutidosis leptorrhynchoides TaxID=125765 RepID=UPI003A998FA4
MAKSWFPTTSYNINIDFAAAADAPDGNSSIESKAVGLKILMNSKSKSNNHSKPIIFQRNQILPPSSSSCFLKFCFLCHKHLSPNKNIYMYRGDQGFCSEECRSRQIYIDDVEQLEIKIIQSRSNTTGHIKGRRLLDYNRKHLTPPSILDTPSPPVFS